MPSNDLARILVRGQCQIKIALQGSQITQVTDPNLIGSFQLLSFNNITKYRQVVVGLRRMRIWRRYRLQQQLSSPKFLEHPFSPHLHAAPLEFGLEHVVELAGAQARLELPLPLHQFDYQPTLHGPAPPRFAARIIVLPRHTQALAHRADIDPARAALPRLL